MGKRMNFNVELVVSDDISEEQVIDALRALLTDLENSDPYHEIQVFGNTDEHDETTERMLDILSTIDEEDVEKAIESIETMEDNE